MLEPSQIFPLNSPHLLLRFADSLYFNIHFLCEAKGLKRRSLVCAVVTQLQPLFWCWGPAASEASLPTCLNQLDGGASCFHLQELKYVNTRTRWALRTGMQAHRFHPQHQT